MGTTLTGKRVQNTYDALLKVSDNDTLTGTAKIIGDGLGNDSPIYLSTTKVGIGVTPTYEFQTNSHAKIGGNLIVGGNFTVNGTTTIIDSTVIAIGDNMMEMAKDNVANTMDIGWYGTINSSGEKYVGVFYDASSGVATPEFHIGLGTAEPSSTAAWTTKGKLVIGALDATTGVFSGQVTIPATPSASTDAASKGYVDAQITAQDLDIAGDSGTGAVDLDSQTFTISGGTNVTTSVSGQTVTINSTGSIDGSGTANDVVMWQDSNTLTDAPIAISGNNSTFAGNVDITGNLKVDSDIEIQAASGYGFMEIGGPSGGHIDLKKPFSDDYDLRLITGTDSEITASGTLKLNAGNTLNLTLNGANATFAGAITVQSGNKLILNRPNNAIDCELSTDSSGTLILNSRNSEGFKFQNSGTNFVTGDSSSNVTFAGSVTASSFIKSGGTSSQYLMADGSVSTGGFVDGSGTANDVVMWSDSNTLTDAPIAISSNDATFAGHITLNGDGKAYKLNTTSYDDWQISVDSNGFIIYNETDARYDLKISGTGDATFAGDIYGNDRLYLGTKMALDVNGTDLYVGATTSANHNDTVYIRTNDANRVTITDSSATFAGKILVGTGATAAASLNAYTQTVSSNLYSALRVIENSGASSYWDIGATGGSSTLLNFYHNGNTTAKISFTHTGGATFAGNVAINGNATLGDGTADDHIINGQVTHLTADGLGYKLHRTGGGTSMLISASGDAEIEFGTDNGSGTNTTHWTIGKDNTDNSFRISNSASLGTSDALTIDSSENATFAGNFHTLERAAVGTTPHSTIKLDVLSTATDWTARIKNYTNSGYGLAIDCSGAASSTTYALAAYSAAGGGLFVRNDDKVGIGTTSPNAMLNVAGTIRAENERFLSGREDAAAPAYAFHDDADTGMFNVASNILGFSTSGTERMRIDSSGNVKVGRSSGYGNSNIQSFIASTANFATSNFLAADSTNMAQGVGGEIVFVGKYATGVDDYAFYGGIKGFKENATSGDTACALGFYTRPHATLPSEKMRITSTGNVGIGTTAPFSDLSINVGANAPSSSGNMASEGLTVHNAAGGRAVQIGVNESGAYNYIQSSYVNNSNVAVNLAFFTGASERVRIDTSGQVGIGTTSPASKLDVRGILNVRVDGGNEQFVIKRESNTNEQLILGFHSSDYGTIQAVEQGVAYRALALNPSGGNVGIGTTTPQKTLHIEGASGASASQLLVCGPSDTIGHTAGILLRAEGGEGDSALRAKGGIFFEREAANGLGKLHLCNNASNNNDSADLSDAALTITQDKKVGIGTTAPYAFDTTATKLHVKNDSAGSGSVGEVARFEGSSDADGSGGTIRLGTSNDRGIYFEGGRTGSVPYGIIGTTEYNGAKTYSIYLQNTGYVGIGTDSPSVKLDVSGSIAAFGDDKSIVIKSANGTINATMGAASSSAVTRGMITVRDAGVTKIVLNGNDNSYFNGGNLGIGTTGPSYPLQVERTSNGVVSMFKVSDGTNNPRLLFYGDASGSHIQHTWSANATNLIFEVGGSEGAGTERMRIDSAGKVSVGPPVVGQLGVRGTTNDSSAYSFEAANSSGNSLLIVRNDGQVWIPSGNVGIGNTSPSYKLDVTGQIRATDDIIAFSDIRVKENVKTLENSLNKVNNLRGVEFNKIGKQNKSIGVIAQEIEKILPEVVHTDDEGMKSVAYGNITGLLIEAVKELSKEVEELKKQIK